MLIKYGHKTKIGGTMHGQVTAMAASKLHSVDNLF